MMADRMMADRRKGSAAMVVRNATAAMIVRELKANAKPLLIWCVVIVLFNVAGVMKFEGIAAGDAEAVRQLTVAFPKVALAVMGISDLDMSTFAGYYAVLEFYVGIMAAVYAVSLARNAVSREMTDGTYEFLFVRPVSRARILTAKLLAALIDAIAFAAVNLISSLLCLPMLGDVLGGGDGVDASAAESGAATVIWRFCVWLFALMLVFAAIAACACAVCARPDQGAAIGNASVVVAYGAGVVYDMFADHDAALVARVLSPFRYATPDEIIHGTAPIAFVALSALIFVLGMVTAFAAFDRRDLAVR